jgi:arylsulfatase A-like enzyme
MAITMDLLPTFTALAGASLPVDRIIDGKNIWPLMSAKDGAKSPHEAFYYYQMDQLQAVRSGRWKLHLPLKQKKKNWGEPDLEVPLQLYDLQADIAESNNVAEKRPEIVKRLRKLARQAIADLGTANVPPTHQRPAGWVISPAPLTLAEQ